MIDSIAGAGSSAVIYSIAETAKENDLKTYDYFEYLLTEIPKHLDESDRSSVRVYFFDQISYRLSAESNY